MDYKQSILNTLLELIEVPSISGTKKEYLAADKLLELLGNIPYFKNNPDNIEKLLIPGDVLNRSIVAAMFKSSKKSNKVIILTGHYDVVGIDEFGKYSDIAFKPYEIEKVIDKIGIDEDTRKDLASGQWIFGRGIADMKYGLALHIELLKSLSQKDDFEGNILFLAVPGEESNSEGMIAAIPYLLRLKEEKGYDLQALLLSECCLPKYYGDNTKKVYLGSCGKIMPLFFAVGKESHVCEPFKALNPNLLLSEINKQMELSSDFCDSFEGSSTPAPVCLKQMDLKDLYSVQNPLYGVSYYNVLTLRMKSVELMDKLKELAYEAFQNTLTSLKIKRENYEKKFNVKVMDGSFEPKVYTFNEIYNMVLNDLGVDYEDSLIKKIILWKKEGKDLQTIGINIIKDVYHNYKDKSPMIIVGFVPPYYPDRYINVKDIKGKKLLDSLDKTINYAKDRFEIDIIKENFFMGICDLSYTGLSSNRNSEYISNNMLGMGTAYNIPLEKLKKLDIPSLVFGGFGKDFHKYTERLNLPYSLEIVPELYEYFIYNHLKEQL